MQHRVVLLRTRGSARVAHVRANRAKHPNGIRGFSASRAATVNASRIGAADHRARCAADSSFAAPQHLSEDGPFLALHPGVSLRDVRLERYERLGRRDGRVRIRKVRVAVGECRGGVVGVSTYARAPRRVVARQPRHGLHQRPSTQRHTFLTRARWLRNRRWMKMAAATAPSSPEKRLARPRESSEDSANARAAVAARSRAPSRSPPRDDASRATPRILTRETPAEMTLERDRRRIRRRVYLSPRTCAAGTSPPRSSLSLLSRRDAASYARASPSTATRVVLTSAISSRETPRRRRRRLSLLNRGDASCRLALADAFAVRRARSRADGSLVAAFAAAAKSPSDAPRFGFSRRRDDAAFVARARLAVRLAASPLRAAAHRSSSSFGLRHRGRATFDDRRRASAGARWRGGGSRRRGGGSRRRDVRIPARGIPARAFESRAPFGASHRRSRDASRTTRPSWTVWVTPNPASKTPTARRAPRPHRGEAPSYTSRALSRRSRLERARTRGRGTRPGRRNRRTFRIRVLVRVERRRASSRDARRRRQTPTTVWWRMGAARAANATAGSRVRSNARRTLHAREGPRPAGGVEVGRFFLIRVASRTPGAAGVPSSRRRAGGRRRRGACASHRRGGRSPGESRGHGRGESPTPRGSSCCSSTAW